MRIATLVLAVSLCACGGNSKKGGGECGDGVVDADEACDDGDLNGTAGCTTACAFACVDATIDCSAAPICQVATCTTDHICVYTVDAAQNGVTCGTGMVCNNGACESEGMCGNGILEGSEQCDFGDDNANNAGCESDCTLSCADGSDCDDANFCNGVEACSDVTVNGHDGKHCTAGTPEDDGTSCGSGLICSNAVCAAGVCGDGFTTGPDEECDDANPTDGDGCQNDCTFSCVSNDPTRNCTPADPCKGQGTCNDTDHTCTPGTPLDDDEPCGNGNYCKNTVCTAPVCPNGDPEPGETCDDGDMINGNGCDNDCTYSCVNPATDCGNPPACQMWTCTGGHVCSAVPDPAKNAMSCGTNGETCNNGACTGGVCGNAMVEAGEECDFGSDDNGPGTGCEADCTFSCHVAGDCSDNNACTGTETCGNVTVMGHAGKKCAAGTPLPLHSMCGTGMICNASSACVASVCGDGYQDPNTTETCEPPNTLTCDAACNAKGCGNNIRSLDEQCDDGSTANMDGCDASCKFEQNQRIIDLDFQYGTSAYCSKNALGGAIQADAAKDQLTAAIDQGVADGSITVIFQLLGLDDLSGTSDPSVSVGVFGGTPVAGTGYAGTADLDWWYIADPLDLNMQRIPTTLLTGKIAAKRLDTDPGSVAFTVNFVGVDVTMDMFNTTIRAPIGSASAPLASTGTSPGHTASEHLDPALTSFATMGSTMAPAELCGATTARSLASTNIAVTLSNTCTAYDTGYSLLDLYIGGCKVFFGLVTVVAATQPDTSKTTNVKYEFQTGGNPQRPRAVSSCIKKLNGVRQMPDPTLDECLDNAGYTSYYKLLTDRVIGKP